MSISNRHHVRCESAVPRRRRWLRRRRLQPLTGVHQLQGQLVLPTEEDNGQRQSFA